MEFQNVKNLRLKMAAMETSALGMNIKFVDHQWIPAEIGSVAGRQDGYIRVA
jgi:hypothetical protein